MATTEKSQQRPLKRVRLNTRGKMDLTLLCNRFKHDTLDRQRNAEDSGTMSKGSFEPLPSLQTMQYRSTSLQSQKQSRRLVDSFSYSTTKKGVEHDVASWDETLNTVSGLPASQLCREAVEKSVLKEPDPDEVCFGMVCMSSSLLAFFTVIHVSKKVLLSIISWTSNP